MNDLTLYQSSLEINNCTRRPGKCLCHIKFYGKFIFSSVHFLHLPNCVTTTGHILKNGPSKSSVSVLSLTVFCIYARLQVKYDFSKLDDYGNSIEFFPLSFQ